MKKKVLFIFALLCTVAQGVLAETIDLSQVNADVTAQNGDVLTGTTSEYKVTIAGGATVTLSGVTISTGVANSHCIQCSGSATIILAEGTTNTLTCTGNYSTALRPGGTGTTLTIQGTGTLKAQSGEKSAGIGAVSDAGGGGTASCGNIVIEGGTIEAKGGSYSAGIGSTWDRSCGDITIASSVKCVSATKGSGAAHCIGNGHETCGTVTIGGVVYWDGSDYKNYGADYIGKDELNIAFINSGAVDVPAGKYYNVMGTGAPTGNKITIEDGATVALSNVNIQKENDYCVKCNGSATIILKYNTVNELTSSGAAPYGYPALWVGGSGTKLTIQSEIDWYQFTGKLIAQGADRCAAIGGGVHSADHTCGDIEIQGGIITATGGICAPGIGSGFDGSCGNITINSGVTRVTARTTETTSDFSIDCIGRGNGGSCGTVTIGDMVFYDGSTNKNHGDDYIARRELSVACINTATVEVNDGEFCLIFGNGNATDHAFGLASSSTAVLSNVHIEKSGRCVNCFQNNTSYITLKDGTTNKLISTGDNALRVGDAGTTLIINGESAGTGKLIAQGGSGHAAIGGGNDNTNKTCGNIEIQSGIIEAKGGSNAPAIGADNGATCGNITISNNYLTAKKGSGATDCIGRGNSGSCGTVTIGGVVYYNGSAYQNNGNTYLVSDELAYLKANKGNSSNYWTTFYNEAGHFQAAEGTQVFKAGLSGETLTLTSISDRIVNANKAVILKSNSANIFLASSNSGTTSEGGYEGNDLHGTSTTITNPGANNYYVLNYTEEYGVGFYKLKDSGTIGAHKAYLVSTSGAREFFGFDEATGISSLTPDPSPNGEGSECYDLQGRKVAQPSKGLYIKDGKKYIKM